MDPQMLQQAMMGQQQPQGIDPALLQMVMQQRQGQRIGAIPGNVMGNLQQAGQNIAALPERIGAIPGQVAGGLSGLFALGKK